MKKPKTKKSKTQKKLTIKIILTLLVLLSCVLIIASISNTKKVLDKKKENKAVETIKLNPINQISLKELNEKIKIKESFILYVGYKGCSSCENYSPILQRSQTMLGFNAYYINIKEINTKSSDWNNFLKKVTTRQKLSVVLDDKKTTIDDTVGNIVKKYGYTPTTFRIEKGNVINAHIGAMSSDQIEEFVK